MCAPRVVAVPCAPIALLAVLALPCLAPAVPAQQSVAGGFPPEVLSPPLAIPGTTNISMSSMDSGDVNDDGLPDLVTFDWVTLDDGPSSIAVFLGTPGGDLSSPALLPVPIVPFAQVPHPRLVDVDADGDLDLLGVYKLIGTVATLLGHGDGSFDPLFLSGGGLSPGGASYFDIGDVDGDGFPDIVYSQGFFGSDQMIEWQRGRGDGGFEAAAMLVPARIPAAVLLRDFDADGIMDLAFMDAISAQQAFVIVHRGLGVGAFAAGLACPVGEDHSGALAAADADGDGDLDLYNQTSDPPFGFDGAVRILHGAGDCSFVPAFTVAFEHIDETSFEVADLDRDGVPDLIGDALSGVRLQRMGHGGPIGPVAQAATPGGITGDTDIIVADLDDDGLPDLVVLRDHFPVRLLNALESFIDLGYGQSSGLGTPTLSINGTPSAGQPITAGVLLETALPGLLFIGSSSEYVPFHGGVLVPAPDLVLPVVGGSTFLTHWPATIAPGTAIHVQAVLATGGSQTLNSNAVVMIAE